MMVLYDGNINNCLGVPLTGLGLVKTLLPAVRVMPALAWARSDDGCHHWIMCPDWTGLHTNINTNTTRHSFIAQLPTLDLHISWDTSYGIQTKPLWIQPQQEFVQCQTLSSEMRHSFFIFFKILRNLTSCASFFLCWELWGSLMIERAELSPVPTSTSPTRKYSEKILEET